MRVKIWMGLFLFLLAPPVIAENVFRITVLSSHDTTPYQQVIEGVKQYFAQNRQAIQLQTIYFNPAEIDQLRQQVEATAPQVLLVLGQYATHYAVENFKQMPVYASMLLDTQEVKQAPNATGLSLRFPLATQLKWMEKFFPSQSTIAVLYNPQKNQNDVKQLRKMAGNSSLRLYFQPVENPRNLSNTLKHLPQQTSALWSFANGNIFTPQTAKTILLYSFRNRIPVIGLSSQWVKAGALYALERDYFDIGLQCGKKLAQILRGTPIRLLQIETPRRVLYAINLKTMRHMKIVLSSEILEQAYETF